MVPQNLQRNPLSHHLRVVTRTQIWVLPVWYWEHSFLVLTQALRENGNAIVPTWKPWQPRTWSQKLQVCIMWSVMVIFLSYYLFCYFLDMNVQLETLICWHFFLYLNILKIHIMFRSIPHDSCHIQICEVK